MDAKTREFVQSRAGHRCEYCHFSESAVPYLVFHVDHIIAKQHLDDVSDDPGGLAWACSECNYHKGPNLVSIDPETHQRADLFQPIPERAYAVKQASAGFFRGWCVRAAEHSLTMF